MLIARVESQSMQYLMSVLHAWHLPQSVLKRVLANVMLTILAAGTLH